MAVQRASEEEGLEFTLEFALRPEIKLGQYKGIRVKMPEVEPTETEFRTALEAAAKQNVVAVDVDHPPRWGIRW